jgi:hypothetical protein
VTNGSKTAVMDIIGFLCVSLGSSTVQLNDSIGSRRAFLRSEAGFSSQNVDCSGREYYQRSAFSCEFFVGKRLNAKNIHKGIFPVHGRKCLSCKAIHNWVETHDKRFADEE